MLHKHHFQHLSESPTIKNKENSPLYSPLLNSYDQEASMQHKIIHEVLNNNSNDYISEQLDSVNKKIAQYQNTIKIKITALLNESTSFDHPHFQKQLADLRFEESNYNQLSKDIDRQQSQVFDYYELEFNKLKSAYEAISQEHQTFLKDRTKTHDLYNSLLENKAILQEDLNARLLQRAELVGQKEELEEFVDQVKRESPDIFDIAHQMFQANQRIADLFKSVTTLREGIAQLQEQKEEKKKQLASYHTVSLLEVQLHQHNQKLKLLKNKMVPIQKSLNLPHPDTLFNEFIQNYNPENYEAKLQSFIQQYRNTLFRQGNQGSNWGSMKEFVNQLEQFITSALQQRQVQQQLNEQKGLLKQYGDEVLLQNEVCTIDFQIEVKKQQIKEYEEQVDCFKNQQENVQSSFHERIDQLTQEAFDQYQEQNQDQLAMISDQYGQVQYQEVLQTTYDELAELMLQSEQVTFQNTCRLIEKYQSSDQAIQTNISMVDQQILPQLKSIATQLSKVKKDIERVNAGEKPHLERMQKIEQEIQSLEQEFKSKIENFQSQELEINSNLSAIKEQIENVQEKLISRNKPNKAFLEQEILQLNNVLTSLEEQKAQLEQFQFGNNKSPSKWDPSRKSSNGVLAISKSLNQFTKMRKQDQSMNLHNVSNNSVVKGITPTKEAANLYLINKYAKGSNSKSSQEVRVKQNFSLKSIK